MTYSFCWQLYHFTPLSSICRLGSRPGLDSRLFYVECQLGKMTSLLNGPVSVTDSVPRYNTDSVLSVAHQFLSVSVLPLIEALVGFS